MAPRLLTATSLAIATLCGAAPAWSLGFGAVRATATIGQPLDVSVGLRLVPGETLSDSCLSATVNSGDNPLPGSAVSVNFINPPGGEPRVRVRTAVRIDEPFVTVRLNIGCEARLSREFTVFADPPALAPVLEPQAPARTLAEAPVAPVLPATAAGVVQPNVDVPPTSSRRSSAGTVQRAERAKPRPTTVVANRSRAALAAAPMGTGAKPAPESTAPETTKMAGGAIDKTEGGARLRLDAPIVTTAIDEAWTRARRQREEALKTAKIAVDVAEVANTSAAQKVAEMDAAVKAARKETADAKAALARLREEQAHNELIETWAPWLGALCAVLLGVVALLAIRLRRADAERLQGWLDERGPRTQESEFDTVAPITQQFPADPVSTYAAPISRSGTEDLTENSAYAPLDPLPPLAASPGPFTETQPSSTLEIEQAHNGHDISIEELLDVEQQAEFFVVLGQDDAAIDLLTSHVMSSGGASPMPYLKLLEIYRRIGDQTSYERTRKRFNARFNGLAPEWTADPNGGRTLDEYHEVVDLIQRAWPNPVDAMAELQTLMFRNDSNLLFDLPAYRDIMMLFTLARDLHDASGEDHLPVDVLLPLSTQPDNSPAQVRESQLGALNEDAMHLELPSYSVGHDGQARGVAGGGRR